MFNKLLICSDGSDHALKAAHEAVALATDRDMSVILLSVADPATSDEVTPWPLELGALPAGSDLDPEQRANLEATVALFRNSGIRCRYLREYGHPAQQIVRVAEREGVDLILIGSRGLSKWKALVLGSVSHGVLYYAHCAVLVVR